MCRPLASRLRRTGRRSRSLAQQGHVGRRHRAARARAMHPLPLARRQRPDVARHLRRRATLRERHARRGARPAHAEVACGSRLRPVRQRPFALALRHRAHRLVGGRRCAARRSGESPERRSRYGRHHRSPPEDSRSHVATLRSRPGASWRSRRRCAEGASAGFSVVLPGGRHEILAWVRDYEKEFPDTYWLETPLRLPPGSRLYAEAPTGAGSRCISRPDAPLKWRAANVRMPVQAAGCC